MNKKIIKSILESMDRSILMEAEKISSLTLNDIYTSTDEERKSRAKNQIDRVDTPKVHQDGNILSKSALNPDKPVTFDFEILSGKSGKTYKAYIRFQDNLKTTSKVKVACRCADFGYRSAYVLNSKSALYNPTNFPVKQQRNPPDGSTNRTERPNFKGTNPDMKVYMCKHLLSCCDALYNEGILK